MELEPRTSTGRTLPVIVAYRCLTSQPIVTQHSGWHQEVSWNSLYNTYEVIQKDYNKLQGRTNKRSYIPLPEGWTNIDGRNREKDFAESANNAYISGVSFARHSLETSEKVEKVEGTPYVEVMKGNGKKEQIHPMTLWEAKNFITRILNYWIESKYPSQANERQQQSKTG